MTGLNHHRTGSGEPLVLIHGFAHHWQGWGPVLELLADRFEVIAVDLPGFGNSPPLSPGTSHDVHAYASAIAGFLDAQGLGSPHVVGNSMGGGIALELAAAGRARSVTAISPVGFWSAAERRALQVFFGLLAADIPPLRRTMVAAAGTRAGRRALGWVLFAHGDRMPASDFRAMLSNAWASPAFDDALAAFTGYRFRAAGRLPDIPVTVAWGEHDRLLFYGRQAPRARKQLPAAEHVTLPDAGHTPNWDAPQLVADAVRRTAGRAGD